MNIDEKQIFDSIKKARTDLERASCLFNELTDSKAVDFASYNLLAAKARYSYLIQEAKKCGLQL